MIYFQQGDETTMHELKRIINTPKFQSKETLQKQLQTLGIKPGDNLIVHSSLSSMGWISGGPQAVVEALIETVTKAGTIVMPAQSADNSDPSYWMAPPVPEEWHQSIREQSPAYDPHLTPLREMGKIAECFHRHPETIRSPHPAHSFMAWGAHAAEWMSEQPLEDSFGKGSPLGKMMKADVKIFLIGTDFDSCTALHYAEFAQVIRKTSPQGAAMLINGERVWKEYNCLDMDSDRFPEIARDYKGDIHEGTLGLAKTLIVEMRPLVEFGIQWLKDNPAPED
jgi:aminoglycoside 3-N-acetyltransferase